MNHLERIAAHLGQRDAVLLTGESNCYYATGFLGEGAAFWVTVAVLLFYAASFVEKLVICWKSVD